MYINYDEFEIEALNNQYKIMEKEILYFINEKLDLCEGESICNIYIDNKYIIVNVHYPFRTHDVINVHKKEILAIKDFINWYNNKLNSESIKEVNEND
jgi:hypothetical protein